MNRDEFNGNLLGSLSAGFVGRTICHPIDTAKSRLQSSEYQLYKSTFSMLIDTFKQEGWRGLYRGYGAVSIGGVPGVCIYFTVYETMKDEMMSSSYQKYPFLVYMTSAIVAEICCSVFFVPVDVIKERMQVQNYNRTPKNHQYLGSVDALVRIVRREGIRGIYSGTGATILSYSPFSALYFLLYEESKKMVSGGRDLSFTQAVSLSAVSGAMASYVTSPLDMAKLRLQIQRSPLSKMANSSESVEIRYRGLSDVLFQVYRRDGIKGLFRGAGARVLFHTPSTAITMGLFEECKRLWMSVL